MASEAVETDKEESGTKPPRFSKKKKIIAGVVGFLLLLFVGAAFAFMGGDGAHEEEPGHGEPVAETDFVDVEPMVVNLRSSDGQRRFVKVHFMIVPKSAEKAEVVRERLPLIIDSYQPFLRELRPEDLAGSAAVYRLKEELLLRATEQVGTDAINDILIQDMVQQ